MFDADAYMTALAVPTVKLNGKVHVGRVLSIEEFMPFQDRFQQALNGTLDNAAFLAFAKEYLRAVFPYRLWMKWRGDPVTELMRSPALVQTLADFFVCQATAMTGPTVAKTNGTDSLENNRATTSQANASE